MADLEGVLGYYQMTGVVNELGLQGYEEALLSRNVPGRNVKGETAMWHVRKPRIAINKLFCGPDSAAIPLDVGDVSTRAFVMPYRFVSKRFSGGELNALSSLGGDTPDDGKSWVDTELREMDITVRQMTNEWLVAQALQGSFTIKYGNQVSSVTETINFGIPATNIMNAPVSWGTVTADILEDTRLVKERLKKRGGRPTMMLMNDYTANLIHKNTTIQNYLKEANIGRQMIEAGSLPPINGLRIVVVDTLFADEGMVDAFESYLIPNNKVIFIPEWPKAAGGWIEMQRGSFLIPNENRDDLESINGLAVYNDVSLNPPGKVVFERVLEFPVIREPWQIGILTVT